jgi:hypothetical protein
MTSGIPSFLSTVPDRALPAVHENIIGQTAVATDVIYCQIFTVGQLAFARDLALVDAQESLLEFLILIPVGDVHGAYAAVQSAGGYKIGIDIHIFLSFVFIEIFPHLVLMQPYRIGIAADKLIHTHPVYCGLPLDPFLLAVYENSLVLCLAPFFLPLLGRSKLALAFFGHISPGAKN